MSIDAALRVAFTIAVGTSLFGTGLTTTWRDLAYLFRRPTLLVGSMLATAVVAPLVALVLWRTLPIGPPAAIAIVAGALAPGVPLLPRTAGRIGGNVALASSLMVVSACAGVVTIPLWLSIAGRIAGLHIAVGPVHVARLLGATIVLPLLAGVALRSARPSLAARLVTPVEAIVVALLPGLALFVLLAGFGALVHLGWAALVAMIVAPLVALVVGHLFGGPEPGDRVVLAIANAMRFPALAGLVATTAFPEVPALPSIVAYFVIALLVGFPYQRWQRRRVCSSTLPSRPPSTP